jgi:PAS domain S-box-containing protein
MEKLKEEMEQRIDQLSIEFSEEKNLKTDYKSNAELMKGKILHLQQTINMQTSELTETKQKVADLQNQLEMSKAQTIASDPNTQLQGKVSELESLITSQKGAIQALHEKRTSLETWVAEMKEELEKKETELQKQTRDLQQRDFQLASAFSTAGMGDFDLRQSIGRMESELFDKEKTIEKLKQDLEKEKSKAVKVSTVANEEDKTTVAELRKSINEYQEVLQQIFDQYNTEVNKRKELQQSLATLEDKQRNSGAEQEVIQNIYILMSALVQKLPFAAYIVNGEGSIEVVNTMLCDLLGQQKEALIGHDFTFIFPESDRPFYKDYWKKEENIEEYFNGQTTVESSSGSKIKVFISLMAIPSLGERRYLGFLPLVPEAAQSVQQA